MYISLGLASALVVSVTLTTTTNDNQGNVASFSVIQEVSYDIAQCDEHRALEGKSKVPVKDRTERKADPEAGDDDSDRSGFCVLVKDPLDGDLRCQAPNLA